MSSIVSVAVSVVDEAAVQVRLIAGLPGTIGLANEALQRFTATIDSLDQLVRRLDRLAEGLTGPLEELGPRVDALLPLLDSPVLREVPDILAAVQRDALPALAAVSETQQQVAGMAASIERLVSGLDDTVSRLGDLPGAGLITRRLGTRPRTIEG